jgi:hypothetical protein
VSTVGTAQRLVVFAAFVSLAAAGFLPLLRGARTPVVSPADLAGLGKFQLEGARLHAAVKLPSPGGSAAFCAGCHTLPAHAGRGVAAAMGNEHAARMDCLVCHWSLAGGARPAPSWQVYSGAAFLAALPAERSSREKLTALRTAVTAVRSCFEKGPTCAGCHRPGGMGALLRPGTASDRTAMLEGLENYFTLPPGEKWYFPQLK